MEGEKREGKSAPEELADLRISGNMRIGIFREKVLRSLQKRAAIPAKKPELDEERALMGEVTIIT